MAGEHQSAIPIALEQLLTGLSELEIVLGEQARQVLPGIQARLRDAMAARDRGDPVAAMQAIAGAMMDLARLADGLDSREGTLMRAVAERFGSALLRGDEQQAKQSLDIMVDRSGAKEMKKQ